MGSKVMRSGMCAVKKCTESGASHSSEGCSDGFTTTSSLDLFASSGELCLSSVTKVSACNDSMSSGYKESSATNEQESEAKRAEPSGFVGGENEVDGNHESAPTHCAHKNLLTRTPSNLKVGHGVHYPMGKRCRLAAQSGQQCPIEFSMCKWSPNGKMLLASGLSSCTHLYHLPAELETGIPRRVLQLTTARIIRHGEPLQDACWLPPSPELFALCCQDHPVQLWNSSTGNVTFSEDGQSLYCGLDGHLKVFATERPGASGRIWRVSGVWVVYLIGHFLHVSFLNDL